jgi:threonine/homoserine/homoserine lactone efflux protein
VDPALFGRGLLIGISLAAPVGPIGVICIRRTLAEGRSAGFACGLGAAMADGFYGAIAGFGLTAVSDLLIHQQFWLRLIGGLFMCYLGLTTLFSKAAERTAAAQGRSLLGAFASTFGLTFTNPMTIFSFAAVFAGLGLGLGQTDYWDASFMVWGVFLGSALWWFLLSASVNVLRNRFTNRHQHWINRISGLLIAGFGIWALWNCRI